MRGWNTAKAKYYYIKNIFQQNSNTKKFSTHRLQFKEKNVNRDQVLVRQVTG